MKKLFILTLIVFLFLFYQCTEIIETYPPPIAGVVTLDSRLDGIKYKGFSFSQGSVNIYPNSANTLPDFSLLVQINQDDKIVGVFFSAPKLSDSFFFIKQLPDADSAAKYFASLKTVPDSMYGWSALGIRANQIWAVKTQENKYGKILILDSKAYLDTVNYSLPTPYGEATFQWQYQPDGTPHF